MLFLLESVVICFLFTLAVLIPLAKNPVGQIMSFPEPIRRRVESLPQYRGTIRKTEKKHLCIKIAAVGILSVLMAIIVYLSGARAFGCAFLYGFSIFMVVNLYDLIVMDLGIFMHCKRFWIPGTEDMVKEYRNPHHHVVGALAGTVLGILTAFFSACLVQLVHVLFL